MCKSKIIISKIYNINEEKNLQVNRSIVNNYK